MTTKNTGLAVSEAKAKLVPVMAAKYGIEPDQFMNTVKATVFPSGKDVSNEQACMFLVVANEYNLNPFIKEIYAFPGRSGGIVPVVSVDGWLTIINRQPALDGIEFTDVISEGKLAAVTARIFRKDRSHPTEVTEYMSECYRDTDVWRRWPNRMLRHKAMIQAARYAFGLSGIYDPDEGERIAEASDGTTKLAGREMVAVITEPQRMALIAEAKRNGHDVAAVINSAGYSLIADIPVARYEEIMGIVSQPKVKIDQPEPPKESEQNDDGAIVGQAVFSEDESIRIDLMEAVNGLITERVGGLPGDRKRYLKGRDLNQLTAEELEDMLAELQSM